MKLICGAVLLIVLLEISSTSYLVANAAANEKQVASKGPAVKTTTTIKGGPRKIKRTIRVRETHPPDPPPGSSDSSNGGVHNNVEVKPDISIEMPQQTKTGSSSPAQSIKSESPIPGKTAAAEPAAEPKQVKEEPAAAQKEEKPKELDPEAEAKREAGLQIVPYQPPAAPVQPVVVNNENTLTLPEKEPAVGDKAPEAAGADKETDKQQPSESDKQMVLKKSVNNSAVEAVADSNNSKQVALKNVGNTETVLIDGVGNNKVTKITNSGNTEVVEHENANNKKSNQHHHHSPGEKCDHPSHHHHAPHPAPVVHHHHHHHAPPPPPPPAAPAPQVQAPPPPPPPPPAPVAPANQQPTVLININGNDSGIGRNALESLTRAPSATWANVAAYLVPIVRDSALLDLVHSPKKLSKRDLLEPAEFRSHLKRRANRKQVAQLPANTQYALVQPTPFGGLRATPVTMGANQQPILPPMMPPMMNHLMQPPPVAADPRTMAQYFDQWNPLMSQMMWPQSMMPPMMPPMQPQLGLPGALDDDDEEDSRERKRGGRRNRKERRERRKKDAKVDADEAKEEEEPLENGAALEAASPLPEQEAPREESAVSPRELPRKKGAKKVKRNKKAATKGEPSSPAKNHAPPEGATVEEPVASSNPLGRVTSTLNPTNWLPSFKSDVQVDAPAGKANDVGGEQKKD